MLKGKDFDIQIFTNKYHSQVKKLEENLYLTHRTHCYTKNFKHTETFGPNWVFIFADLSTSSISLSCGQKKIELQNTVAIYIPAFFIVEWTLPEGTYQWTCLSSSDLSLLPQELRVLPWETHKPLPQSLNDVKEFLLHNSPRESLALHQAKSTVAIRIKNFIDKNYKSELKFSKLSCELDYHRSYLSREFKKNFQISMVEYRHQLRIYEALRLMNQGKSVTEAIFMSGYSSINQFIAYFKKHFLTVPSNYRINKQKKNNIHLQSLVDKDL